MRLVIEMPVIGNSVLAGSQFGLFSPILSLTKFYSDLTSLYHLFLDARSPMSMWKEPYGCEMGADL
jgi:hypothetical protein